MQDKIYEQIKERSTRSSGRYLKALGIIDDASEITGGIPKKNVDFSIILCKLDLIQANPENQKIIDEFHDYLLKLGIETGIGHGKRMIIEAIKRNDDFYGELMEVNPEMIVNYSYIPTFISDMKEAMKNEK